jgi:AcrR family transcriptional regulator
MSANEDDDQGYNLRERQKLETRAKVVEAARALFEEKGYEQATIRDIARRAQVAPGSVFTTFESKAELLQEIIFARLGELFAITRDAVAFKGATADRLHAFAKAAYAWEMREVRLLAENIGASWTWSPEADAENRVRLTPLFQIIITVLKDGAATGEIAKTAPFELIADTIFSCYIRNFRKALYDNWDAEACANYLGRQIRMILAGASAAAV